jgi:dTDP-glucose 4,6-dehydratase
MLSNDTILVTGGAGFIGSHLVEELRKKYSEAKIIVLDNFSSGHPDNIKHVKDIELIECDLRDVAKLNKIVKNVTVIFHLAAQAFIPYCYKDPDEFVTSNILGTYNLIRAAQKVNLRSFVNVSTSEVYGTTQQFSISEDHPTRPHSTYATTKLAAENLAYTMYKEHYFPLVIIRPFNTYGPRDSFPRIIPEVVKQFTKSSELNLGNINSTRDFMYVRDTARGLIRAAETPRAIGRVMNIGTGVETSMKNLIKLISQLMDKTDYHFNIESSRLRPLDVDRLCANVHLSTDILRWKPHVDLETGLKETIAWYKENKRWIWEDK